jgi:MFS family permease
MAYEQIGILLHTGSSPASSTSQSRKWRLFGAIDHATVPVTASLVAGHLGLRVMGLAMGMISAGHSIGAAAGTLLGGYLFDLTLRYEWVWLSSLARAVGAGLMVFMLRDRPGQVTLAA